MSAPWGKAPVAERPIHQPISSPKPAGIRRQKTIRAIDLARKRAEQIHGPLERTPFLVTDNGTSLLPHAF
jgi:hypothetical protein